MSGIAGPGLLTFWRGAPLEAGRPRWPGPGGHPQVTATFVRQSPSPSSGPTESEPLFQSLR